MAGAEGSVSAWFGAKGRGESRHGRLGKFCCVELGPGSARTGKVRRGRCGVFQFGKLRHGMFRQARRCMERLCKERFGVAGGA